MPGHVTVRACLLSMIGPGQCSQPRWPRAGPEVAQWWSQGCPGGSQAAQVVPGVSRRARKGPEGPKWRLIGPKNGLNWPKFGLKSTRKTTPDTLPHMTSGYRTVRIVWRFPYCPGYPSRCMPSWPPHAAACSRVRRRGPVHQATFVK